MRLLGASADEAECNPDEIHSCGIPMKTIIGRKINFYNTQGKNQACKALEYALTARIALYHF